MLRALNHIGKSRAKLDERFAIPVPLRPIIGPKTEKGAQTEHPSYFGEIELGLPRDGPVRVVLQARTHF